MNNLPKRLRAIGTFAFILMTFAILPVNQLFADVSDQASEYKKPTHGPGHHPHPKPTHYPHPPYPTEPYPPYPPVSYPQPVMTYCQEHPFDPSCTYCTENPTDSRCTLCAQHPADPACTSVCNPNAENFNQCCGYNPTDPNCEL